MPATRIADAPAKVHAPQGAQVPGFEYYTAAKLVAAAQTAAREAAVAKRAQAETAQAETALDQMFAYA